MEPYDLHRETSISEVIITNVLPFFRRKSGEVFTIPSRYSDFCVDINVKRLNASFKTDISQMPRTHLVKMYVRLIFSSTLENVTLSIHGSISAIKQRKKFSRSKAARDMGPCKSSSENIAVKDLHLHVKMLWIARTKSGFNHLSSQTNISLYLAH